MSIQEKIAFLAEPEFDRDGFQKLFLTKNQKAKHALIRQHIFADNAPWKNGGIVIGNRDDIAMAISSLNQLGNSDYIVTAMSYCEDLVFTEGVLKLYVGRSDDEVRCFLSKHGHSLKTAIAPPLNSPVTPSEVTTKKQKFGLAILSNFEYCPLGFSVLAAEAKCLLGVFGVSSSSIADVYVASIFDQLPRMGEGWRGTHARFKKMVENSSYFAQEIGNLISMQNVKQINLDMQ